MYRVQVVKVQETQTETVTPPAKRAWGLESGGECRGCNVGPGDWNQEGEYRGCNERSRKGYEFELRQDAERGAGYAPPPQREGRRRGWCYRGCSEASASAWGDTGPACYSAQLPVPAARAVRCLAACAYERQQRGKGGSQRGVRWKITPLTEAISAGLIVRP
eukprot:1176909-Prorocentrum_minimum.AAC.5